MPGAGLDAPLWFAVDQGAGKYRLEEKYQCGSFRYLTVVSNTTASVSLQSLHVQFLAAPKQDLQAYTGWFHSNDELVNRIWYAGAYTNQRSGTTVSPFIGGFELQAHYLADQPEAALDLIRLQWGFMLQDPRMTQSSFIEGYSTDGTLYYAPYSNDARVPHAHGWSTGPTSALSMYAAGIQLTGPTGAEWRIAPQPGNLSAINAGLSTSRGQFEVQFQRKNGKYETFSVQTPSSTRGDVVLPGTSGILVTRAGQRVSLVNGVARGVSGDIWKLEKSGHE
ncbi:hypothetical protein PoHVEF18_010124 [Penicillium ochrochloron]